MVDDFSIVVASSIIEEVDGGILGELDVCAGGNVIEGIYHSVVNGSCIK